jgi:excisionase family DNA binding protein
MENTPPSPAALQSPGPVSTHPPSPAFGTWDPALSLIDEREVARRLRCSEATVTRLRVTGALSFIRISGRLIRFREQDLSDYLTRASQQSAAA